MPIKNKPSSGLDENDPYYSEDLDLSKEEKEKKRRKNLVKNTTNWRRDQSWNKVMGELPDYASHREEMLWVRNHPVMVMADRRKDSDGLVVLTQRDILSPAHGRAPSKGAAVALQYWVRNRDDFFKELMRKGDRFLIGEDASPEEVEKTNPQIIDIDKLLAALEYSEDPDGEAN